MRCAARVWATFVLLVATSGCEGTSEESPLQEEAEEEEARFELAIDQVDVVHGALRIRGVIAEGASDVSFSLGDDDAHRALGRGFATRLGFTWMFDEEELGASLEHGLAVRGRSWNGERYARASADLAWTFGLADNPDGVGDAPGGTATTAALGLGSEGLVLTLIPPCGDLLAVGDHRLAHWEEDDDDTRPTRHFLIPYADFARAILMRRPLAVGESAFAPAVALDGVTLSGDEPEESAVDDPPAEESTGGESHTVIFR